MEHYTELQKAPARFQNQYRWKNLLSGFELSFNPPILVVLGLATFKIGCQLLRVTLDGSSFLAG